MKRLAANAAAATSNTASKKPEEEEEEDEEKDYSSQVIWRIPPPTRASLNALWVNIVWKHSRVKRNVDSMVKSDFSKQFYKFYKFTILSFENKFWFIFLVRVNFCIMWKNKLIEQTFLKRDKHLFLLGPPKRRKKCLKLTLQRCLSSVHICEETFFFRISYLAKIWSQWHVLQSNKEVFCGKMSRKEKII